MRFKLLATAFAVTASTLVAAVPASATIPHWLNSREAPADGVAGDTSTSLPLLKNYYYVAKVEGNVSYGSQELWTTTNPYFVTCGTPTPITYPSPGRPGGFAGLDAENVYAAVVPLGCGNFNPPVPGTQFEVSTDGGSTFTNPVPIGGAVTQPTPGNAYRYLLKGKHQKAKFRLVDSRPDDNDGQFLVRVRPLLFFDCAGNGWKDFGVFKNSLDCTLATIKGGKSDDDI